MKQSWERRGRGRLPLIWGVNGHKAPVCAGRRDKGEIEWDTSERSVSWSQTWLAVADNLPCSVDEWHLKTQLFTPGAPQGKTGTCKSWSTGDTRTATGYILHSTEHFTRAGNLLIHFSHNTKWSLFPLFLAYIQGCLICEKQAEVLGKTEICPLCFTLGTQELLCRLNLNCAYVLSVE